MRKLSLLFLGILVVATLAGCSCNTKTTGTGKVEPSNVYLTLVNKSHELPDNWESKVDIITVKNSLGEEVQIEEKTYEQFKKLREELMQIGIQIELDSVYRSVEEQKQIVKDFTAEYGADYVKKYAAVPGFSEHHTGLAIDIFVIKNGQIIRENDEMIADKGDFAKIHDRLQKYGFILRYPIGKEDTTGYSYEPWHFRYVGEVAAREIANKNISLEEYLEPNELP